jgi:RNA polymerase sigma factor (TIGR02999 family)
VGAGVVPVQPGLAIMTSEVDARAASIRRATVLVMQSVGLPGMLQAAARGESGALDRLLPVVYDELKRIARRQLQRLGAPPTVSTTVLVHEVYERLAAHQSLSVEDERHFYRLCARVMQQVLIDHARERGAQKRHAGIVVALDVAQPGELDGAEAVLRLTQALDQLVALDPALAEVAQLAWLAGLDSDAIARLTGSHRRQVQRHLKRAKAWVLAALA